VTTSAVTARHTAARSSVVYCSTHWRKRHLCIHLMAAILLTAEHAGTQSTHVYIQRDVTDARIFISCYLRLITHHSQPCTMTQRGARDHVCCDRSAHSRSQLCRLLQHTLAQKAPVYTFNGSYFTHCRTRWHAKHPCLHSTRCNRCPHFHLLLSAPANTSFTAMHDDATGVRDRFYYNCSAHSRSQLFHLLQHTLAHKAPVSTFNAM
jgi:hypothetical protein